jgi:hypothetical protein
MGVKGLFALMVAAAFAGIGVYLPYSFRWTRGRLNDRKKPDRPFSGSFAGLNQL